MDQVKRCNGLYLLNEHSDYVLFPIILVHKAITQRGKLWPWRNDSKNILSWYRLNFSAIPTNYISNCSIHSRLTTYQVFFQLQQNVQWTDGMTCMISASTGINGVSLMHISPKQARWPISLTVFFETGIGKEHLRKVYQKLSNNFFSEESPWRKHN